MNEFDTSTYTLLRKPDNTIVRVFGNGFEEPELTQEQHQYNVDFHQQIVDNSQAQLDKVAAFELDNPAVEVEDFLADNKSDLAQIVNDAKVEQTAPTE